MSSLRDYCDYIEQEVRHYAAYGSQLMCLYVCEYAEKEILSGVFRDACPDAIDTVPELRIHGVPIRVKPMPKGMTLGLLKGGLVGHRGTGQAGERNSLTTGKAR